MFTSKCDFYKGIQYQLQCAPRSVRLLCFDMFQASYFLPVKNRNCFQTQYKFMHTFSHVYELLSHEEITVSSIHCYHIRRRDYRAVYLQRGDSRV